MSTYRSPEDFQQHFDAERDDSQRRAATVAIDLRGRSVIFSVGSGLHRKQLGTLGSGTLPTVEDYVKYMAERGYEPDRTYDPNNAAHRDMAARGQFPIGFRPKQAPAQAEALLAKFPQPEPQATPPPMPPTANGTPPVKAELSNAPLPPNRPTVRL